MGLFRDTIGFELENGLRGYCFQRRSVSVEIQLHVASGSIHEGRFLGCGISHFLEHMAFQGCKNFPGHMVADTVNQLGGDINAYTTYDRTCYRVQLPVRSWQKGVEILSAMVRFPELPEERFVKEREVILRECERTRDNPGSRLHENFMRNMFLQHPLRHPVIGYKEMISGVTKDMVREYHDERYSPERCIIVAAGNICPDELQNAVQEFLGDWKRKNLNGLSLVQEDFPGIARNSEFIFPDPLCRVMSGVRMPQFGSPELPALELLFSILGAGDGSILNRKLIYDQQLGVDIRSFSYSLGGCAVGGIAGKCEEAKLKKFQTALMDELDSAHCGNFTLEQIKREKIQQYADRLRELRDPVNIAGEIAGGVFYAGSPEAGDAYLSALENVEMKDLQRAADTYLAPERWVHITQKNRPAKKSVTVKKSSGGIYKSKSSSGASTLHVPDNNLPLCNFFMVLPGGAVVEPHSRHGITRLVAASLSSGSRGISENRILKKLDEYGVDLEISGGANSMIVEFSAPRKKMDSAVALMADILHEPLFESRIWEREKIRLLNSLYERNSNPVKAAFDRASSLLFKDHPYRNSGQGNIADIQNLTPESGRNFYSRMLNVQRIVWGFGGNCNEKDVLRWNKYLDDALIFYEKGLNIPEFSGFATGVEKNILELPREQTAVVKMLPGFSCAGNQELTDAFDILGQAENGLASTLFKSVREDNALSYSVGMHYSAGFHPGYIAFYAMTADGAGEKVLKLLEKEIIRLGEQGLSQEEFEAAVNSAVFDAERIFDTPDTLLRNAAMDAYYGYDPEQLILRKEKLSAMTLEKFNAVIKPFFNVDRGAEVLVLPQKK